MLSHLKPIGSQVKNIEKLPLIHRRGKKESSNSVNSYAVTTKNSSLHSEKAYLPAVRPTQTSIVKTPLASISQSSSVSISNNSHIEIGQENGGQSGDQAAPISVGTFDKQMNLTGDHLVSQEKEVMFLSQNSSRYNEGHQESCAIFGKINGNELENRQHRFKSPSKRSQKRINQKSIIYNPKSVSGKMSVRCSPKPNFQRSYRVKDVIRFL
jgi:hypothetical protein